MTKSANINNQDSFQPEKQSISKVFKAVRNMLLLILYKFVVLKPKESSVEDIFNFKAINSRFASSGQPTKGQFQWIKKAGYDVVIDLTTDDFVDNTVENECDIVTGLGLKYIHIPVDFAKPEWKDFEKFIGTMQQLTEEKVWVHCLVNARASSFLFKYRTIVLGEDEQSSLWDLREVWEPFGPWKRFIYGKDFDDEQ